MKSNVKEKLKDKYPDKSDSDLTEMAEKAYKDVDDAYEAKWNSQQTKEGQWDTISIINT